MKALRIGFGLAAIVAIVFVGSVAALAYLVVRDYMPRLPEPPLKELAVRQGIELGNHALPSRLHEPQYSAILTGQFNFALLDNQPNWHFTDYDLRPSRGSYDFSRIDELLAYTERHQMPVQAHHYLWGEEKWLPDWLLHGNFSRQELLDIMRDHIMTVGGRYRGRIREWTVVNEAFTRGMHINGLRDWWAVATGGQEYIDQAFRWARQADPDSKLILNDFNNEGINRVSDAMYGYIRDAKARGVPIDGIGLQMHIDGRHPPTKDEVIANMQRFAGLGVGVYVTEFDVNMNDVPADAAAKDRIQAGIYYDMLRACIESGVCHSFAILGITDKETWYNYLGLPDARPLMFDKDYRPKPAFYGIRDALLHN